MMLFTLGLCMLLQFTPDTGRQTNQPSPVLLLTKTIDQECAVFKVFDFGNNSGHFKSALVKRDDAAFYYTDEDKQEIIIQKKRANNQYELRYIFIANKKTYEIQLNTCSEKLSNNKKELYSLQQKIISKEEL